MERMEAIINVLSGMATANTIVTQEGEPDDSTIANILAKNK